MDPKTTEEQAGNGAEWFLEAVGKAIEPPPPPTLLEPPHVDSASEQPTAGVEPPVDGIEADSPVSLPETTTELVGQMWRSTGTQDPLEDWEPADLDPYVSRKRNFRWTVWIMAVLIIGAVGAAVALSPRLVERQANAEAVEYADVLAELRATLPATQSVLAVLTEPSTEVEQLSDLVPDLSRLKAAADGVVEASTTPLPQPLPLIPSDALDDLEPARDSMARLGGDASAIADQISSGIAYRSLVDGFLAVRDLPSSADQAQVSAIQEQLALALADATSVLGELPGDAVFSEHRAGLSAAVSSYPDWESAYIAALRTEDAVEATRLTTEHATLLTSLERDLVPALATLRSAIDTAILDLDRELVDTINDLPR